MSEAGGDEAREVHRRWLEAMESGDFEAAWRQTDRLELPRRRTGDFSPDIHLRWNGTPLRDQQVLVRCLHGLGDTVQFARYLPEVRRLAASVTTLAQPSLVPLLQTTPELGEIRNGWTDDPPPLHTVEIGMMELPYIFRSDVSTLPNQVPYLDTARIGLSGPKLNFTDPGAVQVGLVWRSSDWDESRSIPLSALQPLRDIEGLELHSLQQEVATFQSLPLRLHPLHERTRSIVEAAAAMLQLDLIITVDTLAAHLAGALGRPVWLLLKHRADWRWQRKGSESPWYPTMRIFRQPAPGDWQGVGHAVAHAIRESTNLRRAPKVSATRPF